MMNRLRIRQRRHLAGPARDKADPTRLATANQLEAHQRISPFPPKTTSTCKLLPISESPRLAQLTQPTQVKFNPQIWYVAFDPSSRSLLLFCSNGC